ncbi:MAG: hypothetical protein IJQ34_09340 [Kiritimatiellae bacterium]|nr:hypothetical protein [Kiritimatiellia bacterium]
MGYQTIEIKPGFNMIALNFRPVVGTGDSFAVTNLIANSEALVPGSVAGSSDQIQVWDPSTSSFTVYFYRAYNANRFPAGPAWVKVGATTTVTTDSIPHGAGVWFARPTTAQAGSIYVSGLVNAAPYTHDIAAGFNMISSAFPTDLKLNNGPIDWATCGAVSGSAAGSSDQIQVWDNESNSFTVYFYRAYNANRFPAGPAWVKVGATTTATTDSIPAGKGFWYARPTTSEDGELIEKSPLAK